ncbi:hypothetical protein Tco_0995093 [Tanacetum coccineum]
MLVRYLNAIEKEIDARAHHDERIARERRGTKSEMKDECSKSGNDTQAEGPDIRLSNDTKPLHEVQSTVVYNMNANDRQHAEQPKFINEGKRSNVESNQREEVKVKVNFDEIETNIIELEHRVSSLLKENKHLKLVYQNLFERDSSPASTNRS